jgi:flagellar P-ring protein precursor FlgI
MKIINALTLMFWFSTLHAQVRIKDLVTIKGVRENPVIGYGLVIGLKGTGDGGGEVTSTAIKKLLQSLGLNPKAEITSKNVASVVVTAKLPPFPRVGQKIDVQVSSIGDAGSLAGGTLIVTPLKSGDGKIYAVASGNISLGGLEKGATFATSGIIPQGAVIEKEIELEFDNKSAVRLALNTPDFTNVSRISKTINQELGGVFAIAKDSGTIDLIIPSFYERRVVELIGIVENFRVIPDQKAKIIINERTGTVTISGEIHLKKTAIAHRGMTISVSGGGEGATEGAEQHLHLAPNANTLEDLVKILNAMGADAEDLMSIFQGLKSNGSINAEIEII